MKFEPITVTHPTQSPVLPLVCDSPHSGTTYPDDFGYEVPFELLRRGEDTDVDALWAQVPAVGGTLISANFPRTYIDPNRAVDDIDPALLDGQWAGPLTPSEKSRLGYGLIWQKMDADNLIYSKKLAVSHVLHRIQNYWRPYRDALDQVFKQSREQFGGVWHLNLHSMPNNAFERLGFGKNRVLADFVLGDRDGTTCEPGFIAVVEQSLLKRGYTVARNDPYKGVAVLADLGRPDLNQHSLQIEVRRPLYMNEETRERSENFKVLQAHLAAATAEIAEYVKARASL
ncbi:MAG: N-formylglutamate amidohydrolase [Orrella sp.]|uniref:N-formylglutamate amidohydrolase n=1 Tax=Orrella sp. TaxID=1921583 RepID=UPI003BD3B8EC